MRTWPLPIVPELTLSFLCTSQRVLSMLILSVPFFATAWHAHRQSLPPVVLPPPPPPAQPTGEGSIGEPAASLFVDSDQSQRERERALAQSAAQRYEISWFSSFAAFCEDTLG